MIDWYRLWLKLTQGISWWCDVTILSLRCVIVRRRIVLQTSILRFFTTALELFWDVIERYQKPTPTPLSLISYFDYFKHMKVLYYKSTFLIKFEIVVAQRHSIKWFLRFRIKNFKTITSYRPSVRIITLSKNTN